MVRHGGPLNPGTIRVPIKLTNADDRICSEAGRLPPEEVRTITLTGIVGNGPAMLVLPESVALQLGLTKKNDACVRHADGRRINRDEVGYVDVELQGRKCSFTAIADPNRMEPLIGFIVLEALDLLVDCNSFTLRPRDPDHIIVEIE